MGLFDQLKNSLTQLAGSKVTEVVNNAGKAAQKAVATKKKTITLGNLPKNLDELKAMPGADLKDEFAVAALTVAALCAYPEDKDACIAMLNYLKGPTPLSEKELQFMKDRFDYQSYIAKSYLDGATPDNNYEPKSPLTVTILDTPHSRDQINEGYVLLYIASGGADDPRSVKLRKKESTGQWFLWENYLLPGIRQKKSEDAWA